jgi:hypothetical protein
MRPTNPSLFTYEDKLPIHHSALRHSSTLESISLCRIVQWVIDRHDWSIDDNKKRHDYKDTNVINTRRRLESLKCNTTQAIEKNTRLNMATSNEQHFLEVLIYQESNFFNQRTGKRIKEN